MDSGLKKLVMLLVRSFLWGVGICLVMASLEVFGILYYLKALGKLESGYLINVFAPLPFYGVLGVGLGLGCGLLWMLVSRASWYHLLEPLHVRAWERGFLFGLAVFIYLGTVVHARVFGTNIKIHHPFSLLITVGLILLSACIAFSIKYALILLEQKRGLKTIVTFTMVFFLIMAFGSVLYWSHKRNLQSFVIDKMGSAKLEGEGSSNRPNILLITIDTLRADHLSSYGYSKIRTENIDRLARQGVLFEQTIAQSPWTRSSFGSIWTSSYPSQHGANMKVVKYNGKSIILNDQKLRADIPTIAEILSGAGYVTVGISTNPHLTSSNGFARGFQIYIDYPVFLSVITYSVIHDILVRFYPSVLSKYRLRSIDSYILSAEEVYKIFRQIFLKLQDADKPFFLWAHFMDPHHPYYSHETILSDGGKYTSISTTDIQKLQKTSHDKHKIKETVVSYYDGEILYLDHYIGELLSLLRRSRFLANTLVVLTSDHGEELLDHWKKVDVDIPHLDTYQRGFGHGHTMYEEQIRVPLIMRFPDNKFANQRISSIVQHVDLLPTLLAFADIPVDHDGFRFEGVNLLKYLNNKEEIPTRHAKSEFNIDGPEIKQIRSENYKLIYRTHDQTTEFYDLASDPLEQNNLSENPGEPYQNMFSELKSWMARMPKGSPYYIMNEKAFFEGKRELRENTDQKNREELKERFKALGYVQ